MNEHPESFPDPEEEPGSVPFEEVVKGLEGLGADVEREEAAKAEQEQRAREERERAGQSTDEGGQQPFGGMPRCRVPEQLQQLLGAFGLGTGEGGMPDLSALNIERLAAGLRRSVGQDDPQMLAMVMGRISR